MKKEQTPQQLKRRYAILAARLAKVGPILQGTITQRVIERPDPDKPGHTKRYGPYHQWTWKREGKTVTVNLSATQAKTYQRAIDANRKAEKLLEEMRRISLDLLEKTTKGVIRRTREK